MKKIDINQDKRKGIAPNSSDKITDISRAKTNCKYDVFLHCAREDVMWTKDTVLKKLEGDENPKTVCFSPRDGELGLDVCEAVHKTMNSAASYLIVLSKTYFNYEWHDYLVKIGHVKSIMHYKPLVFICKDKLTDILFFDEILCDLLVEHHQMLEYSNGDRQFWQNVSTYLTRNVVNGPNVVTRRLHKPSVIRKQESIPCARRSQEFFWREPNTSATKRKEILSKRKNVTSSLLLSQIIPEGSDQIDLPSGTFQSGDEQSEIASQENLIERQESQPLELVYNDAKTKSPLEKQESWPSVPNYKNGNKEDQLEKQEYQPKYGNANEESVTGKEESQPDVFNYINANKENLFEKQESEPQVTNGSIVNKENQIATKKESQPLVFNGDSNNEENLVENKESQPLDLDSNKTLYLQPAGGIIQNECTA